MEGMIWISDKRMEYALTALQKLGIEMTVIRSKYDFMQIQKQRCIPHYDFVLLPIRGTSDGWVTLGQENMDARIFLESLPKQVLLISGVETQYEKDLACNYCCFQQDERFTVENSALTAEGVLMMLLQNTPRSIYDYCYDIIGIGKSGIEICRMLKTLGLSIRKISHSQRAGCLSLQNWYQNQPYDIIINTAPALVITKEEAVRWKKPVIIIDISSKGCGTALEVAELPHITYFAAPPLPGIVAPQTAGELLAEYIQRCLSQL